MLQRPMAKTIRCERLAKGQKSSREAEKKKRREEKRSREEEREALETEQIKTSHFTVGKVKQHHRIVNIPITILAKQTAKTH